MTVTIYGAGAIGGTVGAYLARAGVPVLLVDREAQHVEAMNRHGLAIRREGDSFTASVRAVTPDSLTGPLDLDYQIALAARIGARHGLAMPLTHALVSMIHDLEAGRRERSLANVAELNALLQTHVHAV